MQCFGLSIKDIGQIDELIEHAQMHNQEYGDNIFVFISKHYGELKAAHEKEHQEEKEDHEKLPFKQQSSITAMNVFVLLTQKEITGRVLREARVAVSGYRFITEL